jgi:hypothetical protein
LWVHKLGRNERWKLRAARLARLAMGEGSVGLVVAPRGPLFRVFAIHVCEWP